MDKKRTQSKFPISMTASFTPKIKYTTANDEHKLVDRPAWNALSCNLISILAFQSAGRLIRQIY